MQMAFHLLKYVKFTHIEFCAQIVTFLMKIASWAYEFSTDFPWGKSFQ